MSLACDCPRHPEILDMCVFLKQKDSLGLSLARWDFFLQGWRRALVTVVSAAVEQVLRKHQPSALPEHTPLQNTGTDAQLLVRAPGKQPLLGFPCGAAFWQLLLQHGFLLSPTGCQELNLDAFYNT